MGKEIVLKKYEYEFLNKETYIQTYNMLKEFTINLFEWLNLPDTIDERFLEMVLFENGRICFFKDKTLNIPLALEYTEGGTKTIYGESTRFNVFSRFNSYRCWRSISTAVPIYNNRLRKGNHLVAMLYAHRIADTQRTMDTNVALQKMAYILSANSDNQLALQNFINRIFNNDIMIAKDSTFNSGEAIGIHETNAPFIADKLMPYKREILNEYLTLIGIVNANVDKKERMITDEVNSNNDLIEHARFNMLNVRKKACEEINKMFGLNIDVRFRMTDSDKIRLAKTYAEIENMHSESKKFVAESENQDVEENTEIEQTNEEVPKGAEENE